MKIPPSTAFWFGRSLISIDVIDTDPFADFPIYRTISTAPFDFVTFVIIGALMEEMNPSLIGRKKDAADRCSPAITTTRNYKRDGKRLEEAESRDHLFPFSLTGIILL